MVDKGLLRIMVKLIMMTIILNAYDVQGSELRLTCSISLSPHNNLWRSTVIISVFQTRKLKHTEIKQQAQSPPVVIPDDLTERFPLCYEGYRISLIVRETLRSLFREEAIFLFPTGPPAPSSVPGAWWVLSKCMWGEWVNKPHCWL